MINRILAGTATTEDIEAVRAYPLDERKKLMERLMGALCGMFEEALLGDGAVEDVAKALAQARPVFAAGLSVDQALGFISKMIDESMSELAEAGEAESDEYDKQELVKNMLEGFMQACTDAETTQGEEAYETVHLEYRGEIGKLEALKASAEAGISNSLAFLKEAYGEDSELSSFLKDFNQNLYAARFIGTFGSPSFFAYKHVAAPGQSYETPEEDTESD